MERTEHRIDTAMGRLYAVSTGNFLTGPTPLVMWPSLMMDHSLWSHQQDFFSDRRPTVCIDPPGHGRSTAIRNDFTLDHNVEVLSDVLDHLNIDRAHLLGNSWGAMVSARFAAHRPSRVASLTLITPTSSAAPLKQRLEFRSLIAGVRLLGHMPSMLAGRVVRYFFSPNTIRANTPAVALVRDQLQRVDTTSLGHALRAVVIDRPDQYDLFSHIKVPTLVVSGRHDRVFPPADGERVAKAIPGARMVVIEEGAHLLAAEVPGTINDLVDAHLIDAEVFDV